jgi:chemotaxis protein MotB
MINGQPQRAIQPIALAHSGQQAFDELAGVADEVEQSMSDLIDRELVTVRRHGKWVEVEIRTDILFPSGVATLSPPAEQVLQQLADTLKPFPNSIRVEGHTDNRPISTPAFPSNWELSAARAASVVHLFTRAGMDPARLAVIGLGENRPSQSNATAEGRNANRRVLLVILGGNERPEGDYAEERGKEQPPVAEPPTVPVALPQPASVEASLPPAAATQRTLP